MLGPMSLGITCFLGYDSTETPFAKTLIQTQCLPNGGFYEIL